MLKALFVIEYEVIIGVLSVVKAKLHVPHSTTFEPIVKLNAEND